MKYLFFLITASALFACTPKTSEIIAPVETESDQSSNDSGMPKHPIGEGKLVFITKCTNCHEQKVVEAFSPKKWEQILPIMIEQANLNEEEAANVRAYIEWELTND